MKKNLYDSRPLDELEEDLNNSYIPHSIKNISEQKKYYEKIAKKSYNFRELANEIVMDKSFEDFLLKAELSGIKAKDAIHNLFVGVIEGTISIPKSSRTNP